MKRYRVRPTKASSTLALIVIPIMLLVVWPSIAMDGGIGIAFLAVAGTIFALNAINLFAPGGISWPFSAAFYGYDIEEEGSDEDGDDETQ